MTCNLCYGTHQKRSTGYMLVPCDCITPNTQSPAIVESPKPKRSRQKKQNNESQQIE